MAESIALTTLLIEHWDTIGLILTNVIALFVNPPRKNKFSRKEDQQNG